jgi:hypothetical protein
MVNSHQTGIGRLPKTESFQQALLLGTDGTDIAGFMCLESNTEASYSKQG